MQNIKLLANLDLIRYTLRSSAYQVECKTSHDAYSMSIDAFNKNKIIAAALPAFVGPGKDKWS